MQGILSLGSRKGVNERSVVQCWCISTTVQYRVVGQTICSWIVSLWVAALRGKYEPSNVWSYDANCQGCTPALVETTEHCEDHCKQLGPMLWHKASSCHVGDCGRILNMGESMGEPKNAQNNNLSRENMRKRRMNMLTSRI